MPSFEVASAKHEVHKVLATLLERYHDDLFITGTTVGVLLAQGDESPCLTESVKGAKYPVNSIPNITPLKMRMLGAPDVFIEMDVAWWNSATEKQREAELDHPVDSLRGRARQRGRHQDR